EEYDVDRARGHDVTHHPPARERVQAPPDHFLPGGFHPPEGDRDLDDRHPFGKRVVKLNETRLTQCEGRGFEDDHPVPLVAEVREQLLIGGPVRRPPPHHVGEEEGHRWTPRSRTLSHRLAEKTDNVIAPSHTGR